MSSSYSGSCLCGQVNFEVDGDFESFYLCHCLYCQKDTGSAHAANLFSSKASVKWLSGADKVTTYTLPATTHTKSFCNVCGSALPNVQSNGKLLVVPAGSLDSQVGLQPDAHLFCSSRAPWDNGLENIKQFERLPG